MGRRTKDTDPKSGHLTMRVEPDLRDKAERLRAKYMPRIPMNFFLETMAELGLDVLAKLGQQNAAAIDALVKAAPGQATDQPG
jgi:hypothetical protein